MNKKKKITILVCTLFMVFSLGACGKTKEDAAVVTQQESSLQIESMDEETTSEESTTFNNGKEDDIELKDTIEIDFTYDYTEDIKADVAYVVSNSSSLQEELKNIDTITQKYTLLAESAQVAVVSALETACTLPAQTCHRQLCLRLCPKLIFGAFSLLRKRNRKKEAR